MPTEEQLPIKRQAAIFFLKFIEKHELEEEDLWEVFHAMRILRKEANDNIDYIRSVARGDE
jgi:hypothetical protein